MNKEEFLSKRNAIDLKLKELNGKKEQLEKEYIESNQGFPVGSKVCITVSAHERFSLLDNERILVPEVKKLAYIADYEIDDDGEVVPSLRQLDNNGGMFAQMAQIERDVGATCLKDKDGRIFLDELPTWRGDPVEEIIPDCSLICQIEFQEIIDRQVERVLKGEISINDVA